MEVVPAHLVPLAQHGSRVARHTRDLADLAEKARQADGGGRQSLPSIKVLHRLGSCLFKGSRRKEIERSRIARRGDDQEKAKAKHGCNAAKRRLRLDGVPAVGLTRPDLA